MLGGASTVSTKWQVETGTVATPTGSAVDITGVVANGDDTAQWYEGQLVNAQMASLPFTLFLVGQVDAGSARANVFHGAQVEVVYDIDDSTF